MKLIIHGGFFSESHTNQETKKQKQDALSRIALQASQYLAQHNAVETVIYAVSLLEDDLLGEAECGAYGWKY